MRRWQLSEKAWSGARVACLVLLGLRYLPLALSFSKGFHYPSRKEEGFDRLSPNGWWGAMRGSGL